MRVDFEEDALIGELKAEVRSRGASKTRVALAPLKVGYKLTGNLEEDSSRYPAHVDSVVLRKSMASAIGTSMLVCRRRSAWSAEAKNGWPA